MSPSRVAWSSKGARGETPPGEAAGVSDRAWAGHPGPSAPGVPRGSPGRASEPANGRCRRRPRRRSPAIGQRGTQPTEHVLPAEGLTPPSNLKFGPLAGIRPLARGYCNAAFLEVIFVANSWLQRKTPLYIFLKTHLIVGSLHWQTVCCCFKKQVQVRLRGSAGVHGRGALDAATGTLELAPETALKIFKPLAVSH